MRKIFTKHPLRSGAFSLLALVGLIFLGISVAGAATREAPLNEEFEIEYSNSGYEYEFVAPSTGELTITFISASLPTENDLPVLFTSNDKKGATFVRHDGINDPVWGPPYATNIKNVVYSVVEGTSYYFKYPYYSDKIKITIGEGGNTGGNEGGEDPENPTPDTGGSLKLNTLYNAPVNGSISFPTKGILTVKYYDSEGPISSWVWDSILFTDETCSSVVEAQGNPGYQTYEVNAGTTYYVKALVSAGGLFGTSPGEPLQFPFGIEMSFETTVSEDVDVPEGFELMKFDYQYSVSALGGTKLFFQPETAGKLIANQNNYDSYLFINKIPVYDEKEWGWRLNTPSPSDGYFPASNGGYELPYNLSEGKPVYWVNIDSSVKNVTFTWIPATSELPEIKVDEVTSIPAGEVYKFVAPANGALTLATNLYDTSLGTFDTSYVFYSSSVHSDDSLISPYEGLDLTAADKGYLGGYTWLFPVEAGKSYYVFNPFNKSVSFLLTLEEGKVLPNKVVEVNPRANTAFDTSNYMYTMNVFTAPKNASAKSATLTYTNKQGSQIVEDIDTNSEYWGYDVQFGAFFLPSNRIYQLQTSGVLKDESEIYIDIYEMKAGDAYVTSSDMAGVEVDNGHVRIKYLYSSPISLVNCTFPSPFYHQGWDKGDAKGIVTLEMSGNVAKVDNVSVVNKHVFEGMEDNSEADVLFVEVPDENISIEGNKIKIDLSGLDFSSLDINVENTFKIAWIEGENGLNAKFDGSNWFTNYFYMEEKPAEPEKVEVKAVTPENFAELAPDSNGNYSFTVTFTGNAAITKAMDSKGNYDLIVSPEPGADVYASEYTFTFPFAYTATAIYGWDPSSGLKPGLNATIIAVDKQGNEISNNVMGGYIEANYVLAEPDMPGAPFDVFVAESSDEGYLNNFQVLASEGFDSIIAVDEISWDDETQTMVNFFQNITIKGENFTANAVKFEDGIVTFEPIITESGDYEIEIPYHAFSVGIAAPDEIGNQGGMEGDLTFWTQKKTVPFHIEITGEAPDGPIEENLIVFNDKKWHPAADSKYYFKPSVNGTLRLDMHEWEEPNAIGFYGELYTALNNEVVEMYETDSTGLDIWGWGIHQNTSYIEYQLEAGVKYYLKWNKSEEYSILATWYEADFNNTIDHGDSETTAVPYKVTEFEKGTQVSYDNRSLELTGEGGVTMEGPNDYSANVRHELNEYGTGLNLFINENFNILLDEYTSDGSKLQGVYKVTIKRGTIAIENASDVAVVRAVKALSISEPTYNEEHSLYYHISVPTGVDTILNPDANGLYKVYNMQGVNVLTTNNALDLNGLTKGLYIVNGKKIIL